MSCDANGKPIQQSSLVIPMLETRNQAFDLTNSLLGLAGIIRIRVDETTRRLTAEYDPEYLSEESLKEFVTCAGYPPAGDDEAR